VTEESGPISQVWHTIGFQAAPPGWRVIFLDANGRTVLPVAGWLIQESRRYNDESDQLLPNPDPVDRRVVAGVSTGDIDLAVEPVDNKGYFHGEPWKLLAPGEPEPEPDKEADAREREWRKLDTGS
jgi:hypothetical protein